MTGIKKTYTAYLLAALIAGSSFALMLGPARGDSAVMDELAHISAGYSYAAGFGCRLNPEHPPLVKLLSGLAMLPLHPKFSTVSADGELLDQWEVGRDFLYRSGNDADALIFAARLAAMLLTLLLVIFVYLWGARLYGPWWALLPEVLTAFSPVFLAHGHYVTTDIGAALGVLAALYFFTGALASPSRIRLAAAGLAFGAALLMKFSTLALIPVMFVVCILSALKAGRGFRSEARVFLTVMAAGFLLVYCVYYTLSLNYPAAQQRADTLTVINRMPHKMFSGLFAAAAGNPVLRPLEQYAIGVRLAAGRVSGGDTVFFLGEISSRGRRLYFPLIFLMKETLPALLIILSAACLSLRGSGRRLLSRRGDIRVISLVLFASLYWACSVMGRLNIGFRHIIPALPPMYILSAGPLRAFFNAEARTPVRLTAVVLLCWLLCWQISSAFFCAPYYLSRFNNLSGGTRGGYLRSVDSDFDWGQDLKRLSCWTRDNAAALGTGHIALDYFGGSDAGYYLGGRAVPWRSAMGDPRARGISWLAVSAENLSLAIGVKSAGSLRDDRDSYTWLKAPLRPDHKAGTSIFIYDLRRR